MNCNNQQIPIMPYTDTAQGSLGDILAVQQTVRQPYPFQQQQQQQQQITTGPMAPTGQFAPITPLTEPPALTLQGTEFLNGALRTQIGKRITVSYLIGTNTFMDRSGLLLGVGANYIVMREAETDDTLFSDFYSIKFVKVYQ